MTTNPLWHHCSQALVPNISDLPSHPETCSLPQFCAKAIKRVTVPGHVPRARPSPAILPCCGATNYGDNGRAKGHKAKWLLQTLALRSHPWHLPARHGCVTGRGYDVTARAARAGIASCAGTEGPWCCGDTCWAGRNIAGALSRPRGSGQGLWVSVSTCPIHSWVLENNVTPQSYPKVSHQRYPR